MNSTTTDPQDEPWCLSVRYCEYLADWHLTCVLRCPGSPRASHFGHFRDPMKHLWRAQVLHREAKPYGLLSWISDPRQWTIFLRNELCLMVDDMHAVLGAAEHLAADEV